MTKRSPADDEWQTVLERIDAWYALHAPAIHAMLRPGASEALIDELETKHGFATTMWSVELLDAGGCSGHECFDLGDELPGIGASPPLRRSN